MLLDVPRCPLHSLKCCILCRVVAAYEFKHAISCFVNEIAVQTKLEQFIGGHKIFAKIDNGPRLTILTIVRNASNCVVYALETSFVVVLTKVTQYIATRQQHDPQI